MNGVTIALLHAELPQRPQYWHFASYVLHVALLDQELFLVKASQQAAGAMVLALWQYEAPHEVLRRAMKAILCADSSWSWKEVLLLASRLAAMLRYRKEKACQVIEAARGHPALRLAGARAGRLGRRGAGGLRTQTTRWLLLSWRGRRSGKPSHPSPLHDNS